RCGGGRGRDGAGLLIGEALDISPMGRDDDESRVQAVILQPLDELAVGLGLGVVKSGMWYLRIERSDELAARAEPLPAGFTHANDIVLALLADLADRVQRVLRAAALDSNLMSKGTPDCRELLGVGRTMLLAVDEVLLRGQGSPDRCIVGRHQILPAPTLHLDDLHQRKV